MAIDSERIGQVAIEFMDELVERNGEDAEIEVLVLCARVKQASGESWHNWISDPDSPGDEVAASVLRAILLSIDNGTGERGTRQVQTPPFYDHPHPMQ